MNYPGNKPRAVLEMKGVSKQYPGTLAVDNVSFGLERGEVHALMGENGAGKSSLMKMMAGSFSDYGGDILIDGKGVKLHSPSIAKSLGIEMIHQELSNALSLSIAENLLAGKLPTHFGFILDRSKMESLCKDYLSEVSLDMDPWTRMDQLSPHEQQLIEIAKALSNDPKILIMDEPTSSLSSAEVEILFGIIDELKKKGLSIIYISHHIPEIFKVADRVTVMRDGKWVATETIERLSPEKLVEMMIGKAMAKTSIVRKSKPEHTSFKVKSLTRIGFFHDISFAIRKGEILGIGGLAGSGRTEIARGICGLDPIDYGSIEKGDQIITPHSMKEAMRNGIAYLSEDRKLEGLALDQETLFNAMSAKLVCDPFRASAKQERRIYEKLGSDLTIYPFQTDRIVSQYSGGNQQKILLAKWLALNPELLILDEPTRGVDIGSKQVIHEVIATLADEGMSILLISSDLPELVELSDRILILRNGHLVKEMQHGCSEDKVLLAANGELA